MSKLLITGAGGQLGKEALEMFGKLNVQVIGCNKSQLDITNYEQVEEVVNSLKPNIILNCAAYTNVDQAEDNVHHAFLINAIGARNLAIVTDIVGAKIIHISTDYVFAGTKNKPYNEFDMPDPQTIYGKSKLAGEEFIKNFNKKHFIIRTSWLYGKYGNNFVKTMLKLSQESSEINVVNDQLGSPTLTTDLLISISDLMQTSYYGTYHVSNAGQCSWYDFAKEIFLIRGNDTKVSGICSENYPTRAVRPKYSVMDHMGIQLNNLKEMRSWKEALEEFLCKNSI
ncbi:dTDP-4-dehydrorhamnose reductase [Metabacillus fastidiosus]|uniref:dTDP-4-dehydrorhamnose reductase n=1 Tax=Metabacillus fastidiosus TaxID=1458 RepID=UPI003D2BAA1C